MLEPIGMERGEVPRCMTSLTYQPMPMRLWLQFFTDKEEEITNLFYRKEYSQVRNKQKKHFKWFAHLK